MALHSVLFVCLGNICRSPTAEGIFREHVVRAGLEEAVHLDSCGTGNWHVGEAPDKRAIQAARARGYDLAPLRARQFEAHDFSRFDAIYAMDSSNLDIVSAQRPVTYSGELCLLMDLIGPEGVEVPDPYYGGDEGFDTVIDMIESAAREFVLRQQQRLSDGQ